MLVKEGFQVLVYTSDDPILAKRLKNAGATSVMPAGSPIGSGQGVLNPNNIRICLEYLKEGDPDYPAVLLQTPHITVEIVRALEQAGLAEVQPHARFLLVNGSSNAVRLDALRQVDGVASVRVDQRYGPASG